MESLELYFEKLELIAFFSGFPLVYVLVFFIAGYQKNNPAVKARLVSLLPYAYALAGLLYLGNLLRSWYPDYSLSHINSTIYQPFLKIWAILSLIFWIPFFSRRPVYSLLHSFIFLYILCKDILGQAFSSDHDPHIIRNEMKVYTDSLLLNSGTFVTVLLFFFIVTWVKKRKNFTS
jgi:hypothetical protein